MSKAVPNPKIWYPQIAPHVHHVWYPGTIYAGDLVQAQRADHFGDIPAACAARVVGNDATILYDRPSEVAPHARTRQGTELDLCAFGDHLLDRFRHASLQCEIGLT